MSEIERAEPPIDGDRISKAIDAAFKETYPDQLKRGTVMYHKLKNAIIENLAPEPPTDGDPTISIRKVVAIFEAEEAIAKATFDQTAARIQKANADHFREMLAAEPPSAPAPCPTNHATKGMWVEADDELYAKPQWIRFSHCPDCGALLGVPKSEK